MGKYWVGNHPDASITVDANTAVGAVVKVSETIAYGDFTDGGSTSGTYASSVLAIPAGATVLSCAATALTGFAGDTSATVQVGDGSDVDRYSTGTPSVFASSTGGKALGKVSGSQYHNTAATVTVTVTSANDFSSVSAGSITLQVCYIK